jgi:hypothetical protein
MSPIHIKIHRKQKSYTTFLYIVFILNFLLISLSSCSLYFQFISNNNNSETNFYNLVGGNPFNMALLSFKRCHRIIEIILPFQ